MYACLTLLTCHTPPISSLVLFSLSQTLVLDFLFPASQLIYKARANPGKIMDVCTFAYCSGTNYRVMSLVFLSSSGWFS